MSSAAAGELGSSGWCPTSQMLPGSQGCSKLHKRELYLSLLQKGEPEHREDVNHTRRMYPKTPDTSFGRLTFYLIFLQEEYRMGMQTSILATTVRNSK